VQNAEFTTFYIHTIKPIVADQEEEALQMFHRIDKNADNNLTHTEIKNFLHKEPWARQLLAGESFHWHDFFATLDTDGDGNVQEGEFVKFYIDKMKPHVQGNQAAHSDESSSFAWTSREEELRLLFRVVDIDGSGAVEIEELESLGHLRMKEDHLERFWDAEKTKTLLTRMDTNGDGVIQEDEFVPFFYEALGVLSDQQFDELMVDFKEHVKQKQEEAVEAAREEAPQGGEEVASAEEQSDALNMFQAADKNGDGKLTYVELKKYMRRQPWARCMIAGDDFHWKDFFLTLDADGDGLVSAGEFAPFYNEKIQPMVDEAPEMDPLDEQFESQYREQVIQQVYRATLTQAMTPMSTPSKKKKKKKKPASDGLSRGNVIRVARESSIAGEEWSPEDEALLIEKLGAVVTAEKFMTYFLDTWHGGARRLSGEEFEEMLELMFASSDAA